jgi:hypothetical protein
MLRWSRLSAVNAILRAAGEAPVNSLESGVNDTLIAEAVLDEHTLRWLTANNIVSSTFIQEWTPDDDGFINLPTGTLYAKPTDPDMPYVQRGSSPTRLWNVTDNTYVFEEAVELRVTVGVSFEELPVSSQQAIVDSARVEYQMFQQGDPAVHALLSNEAMRSRIVGIGKDASADGKTVFDSKHSNAYKWALIRRYSPGGRS